MSRTKEAVDCIVALLKSDPDGWAEGDYTIEHRESGIQVWSRDSGPHPYRPVKISLTFRPKLKRRLANAVGDWRAIRTIRACMDAMFTP